MYGTASRSMCVTGVPLRMTDLPRLPVATFFSQITYCSDTGLSSPQRCVMAASDSGVTFFCPTSNSIGLPGAACIRPKVMMLIRNSTMIPWTTRITM